MNDLEQLARAPLPAGEARRPGLQIPDGLTFEEWQSLVRRAATVADHAAWWVGDLLAYGEWRYGEKYAVVLDELEIKYDVARDYAYVARHVPRTVRRADLSWRHHRVVAKLLPADQEKWLERAADQGWTYRELVDAVAAAIGPARPPADVLEQLRISIEPDRLERWQTAADRVDATVSDWAIAVLDAEASK